MTSKFKIRVLAQDIKESNFENPFDCAIVRACKANGIQIHWNVNFVTQNRKLVTKVMAMYSYHYNWDPQRYPLKMVPEDFDCEIIC